jgi:hypothetical protein
VQELATRLRAEIEVWNSVARRFALDEVLECPLSCVPVVLLHLPRISCLPYECSKREDAGTAMKRELLSYHT